jgi:dual specificity tyrosine-phosphorylation-regulated kinase 2/3/4
MEEKSVYHSSSHKAKRRYSNETLETSSENIILLPKSPTGSSNKGLPAHQVLNESSSYLTPYEVSEILKYKTIYFFGNKGVCKFNGRFSSKQGIYRGLNGDHLHYRYEILKILGRGSFGIVFKCWDHKNSELVAVKIIKSKEKYRVAGELESFILGKIKENASPESNFMVEKKKTFEFRGHYCIVFELLHCTLFNFIQEHTAGIDITVAKRITIQLLQGLRQLHSLRYLHCDLKPDNIMLQYENKSKVKIIDLGSACYTFYKVVPRYIQTRFYRAPEVILGINYDSSIDYWSLGCVLVEMLTGQTLFLARDEEHLVSLIVGLIGDPPMDFVMKGRKSQMFFNGNKLKKYEDIIWRSLEEILAGVCRNCLDFIRKCLVWDPKNRLDYESGLNHVWIKNRR